MKPTAENVSPLAPLLVFGAHPDDIEFGCGGVIALEAARGRPVHLVLGSRGESGTNGTPRLRTAEAQTAARLLGATLEFIDLGGDAHFEPRVAYALKIAAIIRRRRPAIVLAPTLVENQHPDHVVVGRLVRDAARLARFGGVKELRRQPAHAIGGLFYYAITVEAEPAGAQPVLIDVSESAVMTTWLAAMKAHASQMKTRDYAGLQVARASVNGARAGVTAAIPLWPAAPLVFDELGQIGRSARRF